MKNYPEDEEDKRNKTFKIQKKKKETEEKKVEMVTPQKTKGIRGVIKRWLQQRRGERNSRRKAMK